MAILAGCGKQAADPKSLIACQPSGAPAFERNCAIDRSNAPEGAVLTVHHPDGGFRRLLVTNDGHGVIAADGAERLSVRMNGASEIEVMLGGDRYRLPVRQKAAATP